MRRTDFMCGAGSRWMGMLVLALAAGVLSTAMAFAGTLEEDFRNPPPDRGAYVWWHWMGSNFSKEGITKDLQAMRDSRISGATIFNLTSAVQESSAPTENNPWPQQTYRSPAYWDAIRHAAAEADRLGLDLGLHNTVGYSTTGGPWIDEPRSMQRVVWSSTAIHGGARATVELPLPKIPPYTGRGGGDRVLTYYRDIAVLAVPSGAATVEPSKVIDLSPQLSAEGVLTWYAPAGDWTVYRMGHASTGASPHPVPDELIGKTLEVDKMSVAQTEYHWQNVINPLKEQIGPLLGKSLRHFLIDSYEAGNQNWTEDFRQEFHRRKGYDPVPWLVTLAPVVSGGRGPTTRSVESADATARFQWDYRDVVAAMYYENGWLPAAKLIHDAGAKLAFEPYSGPFDTVSGAALADVPMGEFWTTSTGAIGRDIVPAARAAGRKIIGAEAFTGRPENSKWTETPAFLKRSADGAFASGVNRLYLHHWVHQPFDDRYRPGMGMGWWGTHFGRNQTWAEPGKAFYTYLARVQAMLQRGETPVEYVSVGTSAGEGDVISPRDFLTKTRVENGKIVLESGRRYAFIHVPHNGALLPEMVRKIESLLSQGATVVSSKPDRSPSLAGFPRADEEVRELADKIWGDEPQEVRSVGAGRLFSKNNVAAALQTTGIEPSARLLENDKNILITHRRDGSADIFFIANTNSKPAKFVASFLVSGRQPELWDAETGTISPAALWRARGDRTELELSLAASKSIFVVFRSPVQEGREHVTVVEALPGARVYYNADGVMVVSSEIGMSGTAQLGNGSVISFTLSPSLPVTLGEPWNVELSPIVGAGSQTRMERLVSLSENPSTSIKYFSGTATYRTDVQVDETLLSRSRRVVLDLGEVRDMARVSVNGKDFGVLWHPPYRVDVTDALKSGGNSLSVAVTNTWHNRLVGDEQYPPDVEIGTDRGPTRGRALKSYPEWFLKNLPRPTPERLGFVTWFYHRADTPLIPSGLLGPVRLVPVEELPLR